MTNIFNFYKFWPKLKKNWIFGVLTKILTLQKFHFFFENAQFDPSIRGSIFGKKHIQLFGILNTVTYVVARAMSVRCVTTAALCCKSDQLSMSQIIFDFGCFVFGDIKSWIKNFIIFQNLADRCHRDSGWYGINDTVKYSNL